MSDSNDLPGFGTPDPEAPDLQTAGPLAERPEPEALRQTPLDALHRRLGARMTAFAGYEMPVQYAAGTLAEHRQCREAAALFDVSHMGQATLHGAEADALIERLVPGDILGLRPGRQRYTVLLNESGGILDDLMVARLDAEGLALVVNAGRKHADVTLMATAFGEHAVTLHEELALLALQGPLAAAVMRRLCPQAAALPFMGAVRAAVAGIACAVTRSGYTGEDGFEISCAGADAEALATRLLAEPEVAPAGLAARDTLRLEAGLPLHGADIDELTTPVEAGLAWCIGKRRRMAWDFPGAVAIRDELDHGAHRLRVGLRPGGRAPVRAGTIVAAADGTEAGSITSGTFSPTLGAPIATAYVRRDLAADGTALAALLRGRAVPAVVSPLPFVPHRYAR